MMADVVSGVMPCPRAAAGGGDEVKGSSGKEHTVFMDFS